MPQNFSYQQLVKIVEDILKKTPERTQTILSRRFAIGSYVSQERETLEKIGKDYGITRERVRQIEDRGISIFKNSNDIQKAVADIKNIIDNNGGLKEENSLFKEVLGSNTPRTSKGDSSPKIDSAKAQFSDENKRQENSSYSGAKRENKVLTKSGSYSFRSQERNRIKNLRKSGSYLLFLLKIGDNFSFSPPSSLFYSFWFTQKEASKLAEKVNKLLIDLISKQNKLLKERQLLDLARKQLMKRRMNFPKKHILSYVEVSKKIKTNPFREYGLNTWSEVSPRNIRGRAFLVMKKENKPFHFREICRLIEKKLNFRVHPNTLHNELIKNDEFVLIGRGIYALKMWGYKEGTVRDIIKDILRNKGGNVSKEEIIKEVKKQRMVKETTIFLNLQKFKNKRRKKNKKKTVNCKS